MDSDSPSQLEDGLMPAAAEGITFEQVPALQDTAARAAADTSVVAAAVPDREQFYCEGTRPKPRCRGKLHFYCCASLPLWGAPLLVLAATRSAVAVLVSLLFLGGALASLGASAHYHRRQHGSGRPLLGNNARPSLSR